LTISYPLNTPTNIGIANITLSAENAVAISQSPFTYQQQVVAHPGQRWAASISLPPMKRQDAEPWVAFLLSLKGQTGNFLLGDPNCVSAQGSALGYAKNLFIYTEQFNRGAWSKANSTVVTNSETDPRGGFFADSLFETTTTTTHGASQTINVIEGQTYTVSVHVKPNGRDFASLNAPDAAFGTSSDASFDLVNGVTNRSYAKIQPVNNGWFRISLTLTAIASTSASINIFISSTYPGGALPSYLGNETVGLFVWGAQIESGDLTEYQPIADSYGPLVKGAGQVGDTVTIDGCSPNEPTFFKAGDYIQLGSSSGSQLYKVLTDTATNEEGEATIDLWPNLRSSPDNNAAVTVVNTKGRFRLKDNVTQWNINEISSYGITFDCVEVL